MNISLTNSIKYGVSASVSLSEEGVSAVWWEMYGIPRRKGGRHYVACPYTQIFKFGHANSGWIA